MRCPGLASEGHGAGAPGSTLGAVSLIKSASIVSLLTLASRVTGLARELLMAALFGASAMTDAFNVAFRIPNLLRRLFAEGAFSQAFVPVLAATRAQEGEEATRRLIDKVATLLSLALLLTCIIGVAAAPVLVWLMASGLQQSPRGFEAAVFMTRWMFPYIAFMSLVALSAGILNTWRRFAVPAATPVLLNLAMIAAGWWGAPLLQARGIEPIYAMAAGVMLGGVLQLAVQIPALHRLQLLPRLNWRPSAWAEAWADSGTRRIAALMLPALLGVSVAQVSLLINTQIASHLATGSVSWLTYADRLMEFPTALLGVALGVVLLPQLAAARAADQPEKYSAMLDWGLRWVLTLGLPCAVALLLFSEPLVASLYHYGAFTDRDVTMTTRALMGYGLGLLGLVAIKVLAPGFYANQDIRTPVKIAVVVLVLTQLLNLVLVPVFAHAGLAMAIGLGALINAAWLLIGLLRRGSYVPQPGWLKLGLQVLAASAALGLFLGWAAQAVDWVALRSQPGLRLGLLAAVLASCAVIYLGLLRLLGLRLRALMGR
jgi:putative peptidoglycan lipid II flippase